MNSIELKKLQQEQKEFERENPDLLSHPTGPLYQALATERLQVEQKKYEAGDKMALMGAIRICANHDIPLPAWASKAYIAAYDKALNCHSKSWDEVLGKPYPKKHLKDLRQRRELRPVIYNRICEIRNLSTVPLDSQLFETVG